ncbi:MAG: 4-hydroxyphenylacetate 3-hydroxylase [Rhodocyclales bacterium]|nr:4-hydroxyphenylacetate 3-hydroxylase [Rhodocyclales bacterium]
MLMSAAEYRESLRRLTPRVYVDGRAVSSVADEAALAPGVNAVGLSYDFALREDTAVLMRVAAGAGGKEYNRMLHVPQSSDELLQKLEAIRLICRYTGCAQRYLAGDAMAGILQGAAAIDAEHGTEYLARARAWYDHIRAADLAVGIAMTDAKGDRSKRPHAQANPDAYVHIVERRAEGIVISGAKAIVTGGPYMHELLVMPGRAMTEADAEFAVCCAVPIDVVGLTLVARPAGRPGEAAALFSNRYGQSTAVCLFDKVFVPWERVFLAGEWRHSEELTYAYATHHRHTCIAARAGYGDLLIGAGTLITEANGLDSEHAHGLREAMTELIKIVEGFYACGVAASVYATAEPAGIAMPDAVFSNIGKLLLATQIYDMQRLAHEVSGGLIVTLPGPDEDHNPATAGRISEVLTARSDVPYEKRIAVARFIEDLTASYQAGWYSVISLHGGGSPAAMKKEIFRRYPIAEKVELVENLLDRGILADAGKRIALGRQPGRCCAQGCQAANPNPA